MLARIEALSKRLSLTGASLSALLTVALVILIMIEIIGRSFFDYSTMLADEYSGYFYLALVFLGFAYTFDEEGHIRISIVTSRLRSSAKRWVDILAGLMTLAILLFALYYSWDFMLESHEMEMLSEGVSETPLYLTQIPIVVGLGLFALSALVFVLRRVSYDR
jgi:TRAP-type C4-dicarboxylate transport system permease small subunit